jgi:hypothetical protein
MQDRREVLERCGTLAMKFDQVSLPLLEGYGSSFYPTDTPLTGRRKLQPIFEDMRPPGPSVPSLRTGLIYLTATAISSAFVVCIMLVDAGDPGYQIDKEICTCGCFDRRFKGVHFETREQYRQVLTKVEQDGTDMCETAGTSIST